MRSDNGYAIDSKRAILKTHYLYDIDPDELLEMNYVKAIEYKMACADELVRKLLVPHYSKRDDARLSKVLDARKFNEGLLKELKEVQKYHS